jgi:mannosyltransferase
MIAKRFPQWLVMLPLLLIGFGLRIFQIDNQSFWTDEMATWEAAHFWPNPIVIEAPMYAHAGIVAISLMTLPRELGARWPSVIAGLLAMALVYQVGKRLHSSGSGLIGSLLITVSPIAIYYSQEARSYAFIIFGSLLALWTMLLSERRISWAKHLCTISVVITVALHLVSVLWLMTLIIFMSYRKWRTGRGPASQHLMLLSVAAILVIFLIRMIEQWGEYSWITYLNMTSPLDAISQVMVGALSLPVIASLTQFLSLVILIAIIGLGVKTLHQPSLRNSSWSNGWSVLLLIALVLGPVFALISFSYVRPLWVARYVLPSMVSILLLAGVVLGSLRHKVVMITGILLLTILSLSHLGDSYRQRPEWRSLMIYIAAIADSEDTILICPLWQAALPRFYAPQGDTPILPIQDEHDPTPQIAQTLENGGVVFVILADSGCYDPEDYQAQINDFEGLRLFIYR